MNGFRDIIIELCAELNLGEPSLSARSAAIQIDDITVRINDNGNDLTLTALAGTLPSFSPDREDKTRKLLQGSLSILRSHSMLIYVKTEQGQKYIAVDSNIPKVEFNTQSLKEEIHEFHLIVTAIKNIITTNRQPAFGPPALSNPTNDSDEMEFVFRA